MPRLTSPSAAARRLVAVAALATLLAAPVVAEEYVIGREVAVDRHLQDGEEFDLPIQALVAHGKVLFDAMWTEQEGGGRPLTTGTGGALHNPDHTLVFPHNFNRVSAPDANSCFGCHNIPGSGGGGDIVANVFVLGQRFDHVTFDENDLIPLSGSRNERGELTTLERIANSRATLGMFGAGYVEMLARQMTFDLRAIAAEIDPGEEAPLVTKGVSFGVLRRGIDGTWDTSEVVGLPPGAVTSAGPDAPPSLVIAPFHQVGAVVSLRQFSNNAFNHHHGIQSTERFGDGTDPDGDGFTDEMTRADVTAVSVYQATLPPPGRVIPRVRAVEEAVWQGEQLFAQIGCGGCHVPALPLENWGWFYYEPNPFNPAGNLRPQDTDLLVLNLNGRDLPQPRLRQENGVTWVPAYTDLKLHDITTGPDDYHCEGLDQHAPGGSDAFFEGNCRFLTKKLWGAANEPPYFHHGKLTTLRSAVLAHNGEAVDAKNAFVALSQAQQDAVIEFLKSLQVLPEGTTSTIVDQDFQPRSWPPDWAQ